VHGVDEEVGVGREEVAQRSGGQPDLSSDGADGRGGDAVADYDPPHALGDGLAALVVVDELRHGVVLVRLCYRF
jgi:hypothetical protein